MPRAYPWRGMARFVAARWWQRHPVHAAYAVARPALRDYARARPGRLVLGAAAVGSLLVLTRPWRMASGSWLWRVALTHGVAAAVLLAPRKLKPASPRERQR